MCVVVGPIFNNRFNRLIMFKEVWKDVPGYEGLYQVSDLGRVKSLNYRRTGKEQILKPAKDKNGYLQVHLCNDGEDKVLLVHRLVWIAFNGPIPEGYEVNHINENKQDNRLENLNLLSHKANTNWGTRNERAREKLTNGKCSKWVIKLSLNNEILHFYPSTMQVERELGYSQGHISKCCNGKRKTAYGFVWKYAE